jgi:glyoxylase-like metal-dependent hydrolase (beta-lactamase superfamily II)
VRRVMVGDVELVSLLDGTEFYDADAVYIDAGDALGQYADLLDPAGRVMLPFSSFLLRGDGQTVLVDTGNGPEAQGQLIDELRGAGAGVGDIDIVVFTHLHGDHTGWNIDRGSGAAGFPNARYLVPRGDWDYYRAADPPPASFSRDIAALDALGALDLIDGGQVISPSLTTLHTPGHTPGHMTVAVRSNGSEAYVVGDAFLTAVDVAEPDWVTSWDWSAPDVRRSRRSLLERVAATDAVVAASHLPAPGLGRFAVASGRRTFRPLP